MNTDLKSSVVHGHTTRERLLNVLDRKVIQALRKDIKNKEGNIKKFYCSGLIIKSLQVFIGAFVP